MLRCSIDIMIVLGRAIGRKQVKLLVGARWGRQYLDEALERAESERQGLRQALLIHSRIHEGSEFKALSS